MSSNITELFKKPLIIGLIGNVNSAKSNLVYDIIEELNKDNIYNLYVYGLRSEIKNAIKIHSVEELEIIRDSVIFLDEVMSLWDLDNRKAKRMIESSLRLINHNNNILIVVGVPDNFRKFIAGKLDIIIFKRVTLTDFVNGSRVKNVLMGYKGSELGSHVLNLKKNEAIIYDGLHYYKLNNIPYHKKYDTKAKNVQIIVPKKVHKGVKRRYKNGSE